MTGDDELEELIGDALRVEGRTPSDERRRALRRAVDARAESGSATSVGPGSATPVDAPDRTRSRRRTVGRRDLVVGAAAAAIGAAVGVGVSRNDDTSPAPAAVPTEPLAIEIRQSSATADGRLINHTWGTELVLDVSGLAPGRVHDVVYASVHGEVQAGSFLSVADVVMHCRFNASTLRADLSGITIRDRTTGETVIDTRLS